MYMYNNVQVCFHMYSAHVHVHSCAKVLYEYCSKRCILSIALCSVFGDILRKKYSYVQECVLPGEVMLLHVLVDLCLYMYMYM